MHERFCSLRIFAEKCERLYGTMERKIETRENDEMHDPLEHRRAAGAERNHANEQSESQQHCFFCIDAQRKGFSQQNGNCGHCGNRQSDARQYRT